MQKKGLSLVSLQVCQYQALYVFSQLRDDSVITFVSTIPISNLYINYNNLDTTFVQRKRIVILQMFFWFDDWTSWLSAMCPTGWICGF